MSVSDGQRASASVFNAAFLSRISDSDTVGRVGLNNTSDVNSGARIFNIQRAINALFTADGTTGETDTTSTTYSSTKVISNGDSRKTAIGKLDAEFHESSGHAHTGAAGQGPTIRAKGVFAFNGDADYASSIGAPVQGSTYFNLLTGAFRCYNGTTWNDQGGFGGDILPNQFRTIANGQAVAAAVGGFTADSTIYHCIDAFVCITRTTSTTFLKATGQITCQFVNGAWRDPIVELRGDDMGLTFSMVGDSLYYTSDTTPGSSYVGTMEFRGMLFL